jgi:hypothetical protein
MSGCIDKEQEQLLHDYELGLLSDEDNCRFEMHLYECDYCLAQVREFMDVSRILARDPDARAMVDKVAGESESKKERKKHSPYLRLLIAAVLIVIVIVPIYRYGIYEEPTDVLQTLELLPARTGGSDIIYLKKGGNVAISFYVVDEFQGTANLMISKVDGDTMLSLEDFSDFNELGLGTITIPVTDFSEGHYMLIIEPLGDSTTVHDIRYMFRVK